MKRIVALFGPSGCGKDTIKKSILDNNPRWNNIIPCTTRPKREGEQEDINYHFLTEEQFAQEVLNGEIKSIIITDSSSETQWSEIEKNDYIPEIDTTVPLMTINKFDIHAIIYSQGLSSTTNEWDGTIPVSENIPSIIIKAIGLAKVNDNVNEVIE